MLRSTVWTVPVVAAATAAPAFASSTSVTLRATKVPVGLFDLDRALVLTFTGGAPGYTVTLVSITYTTVLGTSGSVPVDPATTYGSLGGTFQGPDGSASAFAVRTYVVTYVFNSHTVTSPALSA